MEGKWKHIEFSVKIFFIKRFNLFLLQVNVKILTLIRTFKVISNIKTLLLSKITVLKKEKKYNAASVSI